MRDGILLRLGLRRGSSFLYRPSSSSAPSLSREQRAQKIKDGPDLQHFILNDIRKREKKIMPSMKESSSYLSDEDLNGEGRRVKYVTYGCQMNVNDMEIVRSVLQKHGYKETKDLVTADIVMLMTCSIREGAEKKIWKELARINKISAKYQTVGVLGCMAENVKHALFTKKNLVHVVAGPDSYRDLPRLLAITRAGSTAINVQLSLDETYADVAPVRVNKDSRTAFVSIMRGCDNMCSFCVVPFTRGRERSRPIDSILEEVRRLSDEGVKQVTLLGQNVNSYRDMSSSNFVFSEKSSSTVEGFYTVYKAKQGGKTFSTLLDKISMIDPEIRIRFTSPHPKDFPMEVLQLIKERPNICNQLHIPAQSGDNETLERMGRGYTREVYLQLINDVKNVLPDVSITSDFIAGFCGETEEAHQQTLDLMRQVKYSFCYVFPYSMRGKTRAHHHLTDDVPEEVKRRRHDELAKVFREEALGLNTSLIGSTQTVLVEGVSKRSATALQGRTDGGTKAIFENVISAAPGNYVKVKIRDCSSQTLIADAIELTQLTKSGN